MKVAILANSHVHMLKHAIDQRAPSWSPTLFAAPARGLYSLRRLPKRQGLFTRKAELSKWLARTSGGLTEIRYDEYDSFAIVGLALRTHGALRLFDRYQPHRFRLDKSASLISESAFREAAKSELERSAGYRMMRLLSNQKQPVVVVPAPFPHHAIMERSGYQWMKHDDGTAAIWINGVIESAIKDLAHPFGYKVLSQPAETISSLGLTKPEYGVGAKRITGGEYGEQDISHMGPVYGHIVLNQIGDALGAKTSANAEKIGSAASAPL